MKEEYAPKTLETKLGKLVEECGEVLAAVGKIQRWGLWSFNPELGPNSEKNIEWLARELKDLADASTLVADELLEEVKAKVGWSWKQ